MNDFLRAIRLLLPSQRGMAIYAAGCVVFLSFIATGLRIEGNHATLWGLSLTGAFGVSPQERRDGGFVEMLQHAWTFGSLAWLCFSGTRPVLRTFEPQFQHFLRFSHRSRLFVETVRITAVAVTLGIGILPLAAGAAIGGFAGVRFVPVVHALVTCLISSTVAATSLYGLTALRIPSGIAIGIGWAAPWFLTAIGEFLRRNDVPAANWLPVGLPYTVSTWHDPEVSASAAVIALGFVLRLAFCIRTRRA